MSAPESLPLPALRAWMAHALPTLPAIDRARRLAGGQSNPTWLLEAGERRYVLRSKPGGRLLASAHAIDREFRVMGALVGSPVPVATPLAYCDDETVIGSAFYVMSHVPGEACWDPAVPDADVTVRHGMYAQALQTLVALANLDVDACGLSDYGRPGNYFARQITRWTEQYRASETESIAAMDALIQWLPTAAPDDATRAVLVHGDFRFDNLLWSPQGELLAVVDWELSTLGHPLADLGYFCMALRLPRNGVLPGLAGLSRSELGIAEEEALVSAFARATGHDPGNRWRFHLAFHFFRLAAIAQGVMKRALQGNAANPQALAAGRMTRLIAQMGADVAL
ncbi:phosphotransferase family protein [Tahibacter amnicola]|uniref:Phosphotransferase family protein n=1 Tax=Tahibacter amnicola TaxID=2976241 RepID=A0ABY6BIZ3_9GAMM|nr:phosphotransferase family protein [Tahibacter amnicola]UXI69343.1 phosphotransferase family protein [Tahibacter amnicola]